MTFSIYFVHHTDVMSDVAVLQLQGRGIDPEISLLSLYGFFFFHLLPVFTSRFSGLPLCPKNIMGEGLAKIIEIK